MSKYSLDDDDDTAVADKSNSLLRSGLIVSLMTFISRILGLARDICIAFVFGAGSAADVFFVAFKIPNFLRRLFAEGAFNQAFIPVLSEVSQQEDKQALRSVVKYVSGSLLLVLALVTCIAVLMAPWLVWLIAPGFASDPEKMQLTTDMLRLTFPYLLLISMAGLFAALLNHSRRFALPAALPIVLNVCLIGAIVWLSPKLAVPIVALAWGVLLAGVLQVLLQLPFVASLGLLTWPRINFNNPRVKQIMWLMVPALFGVSVAQINLLLDTILASLLQSGSVSWLYYSDRLMELPLGMFGIAIATVILPSLSRQYNSQDYAVFSNTMDWALRMVLLIGLPSALALWLIAEPLLATLFQYGAMTANDVIQSASSLRAYAFGLVAFMLIKVLAPGFFARQDIKTPVRIGIQAMAANMVFNLLLVWQLAHTGLALATTLSAFINASLLGFYLWRQKWWQPTRVWKAWIIRLTLANSTLVAWLMFYSPDMHQWFSMTLWQRVETMTLLVTVGVLLYVVVLFVLGIRKVDLQSPAAF